MVGGLTYPEVGATRDAVLPEGYHPVRQQLVLGSGDAVFTSAVETLLSWQMHDRAGVRRIAGPYRVVLGVDATFRCLGQTIPCRVVDVVDEIDRQGFAYGTLPGHPETGEERFVIERDSSGGEVTARITAFSRPGTWRTRLIGPAGRLVQRAMTERYLKALVPR